MILSWHAGAGQDYLYLWSLHYAIANTMLKIIFSDIQFWKSRKSLEGLSIRSIIFNIFTQLIVVLYVLDNDTNTMVAISVCIGLVIEAWKITKVMDITVRVPCLALLKVFIFPHSHDFHNALYIILIYALGVRIARKISKKWIE